MSKIYAVVNTKGGVGKTTIAYMVLPYLLYEEDKTIVVSEMDNSNNTSDFFIGDKILEFKSYKIDKSKEKLKEISFNSIIDEDENVINIIDCGAGDNTKNVIEQMYRASLDDIVFVIPFIADPENASNVKDTIDFIKNMDFNNFKIWLLFNKMDFKREKDIKKLKVYVREKYIGIFDSDKWKIKGIYDEIKDDIDKELIIYDSIVYSALKVSLKMSLLSFYISNNHYLDEDTGKEMIKNFVLSEGREKAENEFFLMGCMKDIKTEILPNLDMMKKVIKNESI